MDIDMYMSDLLENLERYIEASNDLREKKKACEYDQGYFLHREIQRVKDAKESIKTCLLSVIDERIRIQKE